MDKLGKYCGKPVKSVWIGTDGLPIEYAPVVRCKDCKHCKKYTNRFDPIPNRQLCNRMYDYAYRVEENDFCSYGERRTDDG